MYFCKKNKKMVKDIEKQKSITLLYGIAEKSYFDMTTHERKQAGATAFERIKEAAFTRGLPIIYGKNGFVIAEYVDGKRYIRENGKDIRPYYVD
jgi:uncharacterized protein (DUF302 family)